MLSFPFVWRLAYSHGQFNSYEYEPEVESQDDIGKINELIKVSTRLEHFIISFSMNRE